jgi:uncharacterized membrane-anchored protein
MNRRAAFLLALMPQLAFVGWLTWQGERTLALGRLVTLEIEATAPIDPLRGRFLRLEFDVNRVNGDIGPFGQANDRTGDAVYVELMHSGDQWWPFRYALEPIERTGSDTVVLRGTIRGTTADQLLVDYAFDQYFVPNDGLDVHAVSAHRLRAKLRVDERGHGVVEDVLVDGEPYLVWNARERERSNR